jgi:hypothetical protein
MHHSVLLQQVKFWDKGDAPPVFQIDDINYIFIRRNSLLIVCTTKYVFLQCQMTLVSTQ